MFIVPVTRDSRHLSRLFDDTLDRFFGSALATESSATTPRSPALDVAESERQYTVLLEMPGVTKDDVKVAIDGRQVTVEAQTERRENKHDDPQDGGRVVYRERQVAGYARSFTLPAEIDQAESSAKLEHGVLTLTLLKRAARNAARVVVS